MLGINHIDTLVSTICNPLHNSNITYFLGKISTFYQGSQCCATTVGHKKKILLLHDESSSSVRFDCQYDLPRLCSTTKVRRENILGNNSFTLNGNFPRAFIRKVTQQLR